MDSECPDTVGIAGQARPVTGGFFTSDARTFGSEFRLDLDAVRRPPGSRHRRSADGDGR